MQTMVLPRYDIGKQGSQRITKPIICLHEERLGPKLPIERTIKTLIRLGIALADLSLRWAQMPYYRFCHALAQGRF